MTAKSEQFFLPDSAAGPLLRLLDPETAHNVGLRAAAAGLFPRETRPDPPRLATSAWGRHLSNPFGGCSSGALTAAVCFYIVHIWQDCAGNARTLKPDPLNGCAGLAAGFDKGAEAVDGLLGLGLGFMEIGALLDAVSAALQTQK